VPTETGSSGHIARDVPTETGFPQYNPLR
jgi:hypothetical protein